MSDKNHKAKPAKRQLKKILGSAFGIAVMVGGIIGAGILRNPGPVAEMLHNKWLIIEFCEDISELSMLINTSIYGS